MSTGKPGSQGGMPGYPGAVSPSALAGYPGAGGAYGASVAGYAAYPGMTPAMTYPGVYMPAPAAAMPYGYPSAALQMARPPVPGRRHYGVEQAAMGVRVGEFHTLSAHAPYVPQQVAMQLQLLWDSGNQLVSLLDEGSWRALTELEPAAGLQVVNEVAEAMNSQTIRNINAYLIAIAKKHFNMARSVNPLSPGGPVFGMGGYGGAGAVGAISPDPYAGMGGGVGGGGGGGGSGGGPSGQKGIAALHKLQGPLRERAQGLLEQHNGTLRETHFDEVVVNHLQRLPEADAMEVLNEVGRHELVTVKNIPAYIMGIIGRIRREGGGAPRALY